MSELRKSSLGGVPASEQLVEMAEQLLFRPSVEQRRLKASFWAKQRDLPVMIDGASITETQAMKLTGDSRLRNWWKIQGFKDWFTDSNEYTTKVEFLFDLSLEALERIIQNEDPKAQSARVNGIKLIAELANKMPNRWAKTNYADELIAKMDEVQLEAYLERKGVNLKLTSGAKNEKKAIEATVLDTSVLGDQ